MKILKSLKNYFTPFEIGLFIFSEITVILSFILWDGNNYFNLICSLIGVVSVMFCIKGHPFGALLGVAFALIYSVTSFKFRYYGEFFTYTFMNLPMCIISFVSWLKNPFKKGEPQIKVGGIKLKDLIILILFASLITTAFYFILRYFNTANLVISTISIATSFSAVYLMYKRSPFYSIAYIANDLVLITLWILASLTNRSYITIVVCFTVFLINDVYGFISWKKMQKLQKADV